MSVKETFIIRKARREDVYQIMDLKIELAAYQHMTGLPMLSVELQRDGFDIYPPRYHCLVAEISSTEDTKLFADNQKQGLVGYALYFYAFAATEGKVLHLEDLCVSEKARGKNCGSKFMKELAKVALEENCVRMQLEVLDWNPAKKFYEKHGGWNSTKAEGWHNFRLGKDAIKRMVADTNVINE